MKKATASFHRHNLRIRSQRRRMFLKELRLRKQARQEVFFIHSTGSL